MNISLSSYVCRSANGEVDVKATKAKFANDLTAWETSQKADSEAVVSAMHSVFDAFPDANINTPALISAVAAKLGTPPIGEAYTTLALRVKDAVKSNASTFQIRKGQGGGVHRLAPAPVAATA